MTSRLASPEYQRQISKRSSLCGYRFGQTAVPATAGRRCPAICVGLFVLACPEVAWSAATLSVFNHVGIQFGGSAAWNSQPGVNRLDNGRIVERQVTLPALGPYSEVTTQLNIWAADDPWDRAGSIQLVTAAGVVELHKFVTGFGGTTQHQQQVTNLAPYLRQGPVTIRAFIDTWVPQAWALDFNLTVTDDTATKTPRWNRAVFNDQDWRSASYPNNRRTETVTIPASLEKVYLNYLASGHASDGTGGDEFTQRTHKIFIDGIEVFNEIPWRTDGVNFRSVNPRSGRFGNVWSSDLDRAGWIPGDDVDPYVIDVSQYLTAGTHTISYEIAGVRPGDSSGYGYWRVSSYLTGVQGTVSPADVNLDRAVDGADFLIWQRGFGRTGDLNSSHGDISGNGNVGGEDLVLWQSAFGALPINPALSAVPEPPASAAGMCIVIALIAASRRPLLGIISAEPAASDRTVCRRRPSCFTSRPARHDVAIPGFLRSQ
ncbi:MAG: hypothetical protein KF847_10155 [Pirellulales bacterium]|nr:hypothetical protein [Pirellulales bacterium]